MLRLGDQKEEKSSEWTYAHVVRALGTHKPTRER